MEFTPRIYQKKIIDFILTHDRGAVFAGMGMGKTSSTLAALEELKKKRSRGVPCSDSGSPPGCILNLAAGDLKMGV